MAIFNSYFDITRGYSWLIFRLPRCSFRFCPEKPAPRWFHVTSRQEPEARTPQADFLLWLCLKIVDLQRNEDKEVLTNHWNPLDTIGLPYLQTHVAFSCMLQPATTLDVVAARARPQPPPRPRSP